MAYGKQAQVPQLPSIGQIGSPLDAYGALRALRSYRGGYGPSAGQRGDITPEYRSLYQQTMANPYAREWDASHEGGGYFRGVGTGLKKGIQTMGSREGRIGLGKVAAVALGGTALAGGFGGGAGAAGAGGAGGSASLGGVAGGTSAGGLGGIGGVGGTLGGGGSMVGAMGGGGFPWAAVAQGGSQLLSGYMNKRASDKAGNKQNKNTQAALAQLSPEAIRQLVQMFYTQNYAMLNPQMQAAQRGLASSAGRTGLTGAGVVQQLRAGIPGQFANMALNEASQQGLNSAAWRARIQAGQPIDTPYSFGNDLQGIMQMLGRYGILRNNQQPTQPQPQNQWWINGPGYDDNEYR